MSDAEVSADGSHFSTRTKPDPRERQIDEAFLARDYRRDASGRFHVQPTPTSSMLPRVLSDESSSKSKKNVPTEPGGDRPATATGGLEAPPLLAEKSTSSDKTNLSTDMDMEIIGAPILLSSDTTAR